MKSWSTHRWLGSGGRALDLGGQLKTEYVCINCKRHFVRIDQTGELFAAYPTVLDFDRLAQDVTERWLNEPCPGREQESDVLACINRPQPQVRTYDGPLSEDPPSEPSAQ